MLLYYDLYELIIQKVEDYKDLFMLSQTNKDFNYLALTQINKYKLPLIKLWKYGMIYVNKYLWEMSFNGTLSIAAERIRLIYRLLGEITDYVLLKKLNLSFWDHYREQHLQVCHDSYKF